MSAKLHRTRASAGFALVIVLWSLATLSLMVAALTTGGRTQLRLAAAARDGAQAEAAADGATRHATFALLAGRWTTLPGKTFQVRIGEALVEVALEDEAAKINPNRAGPDILARLLGAVGVDVPLAARLAAGIVDWRSRGRLSVSGAPKIDQYRARGLPYGPANRPFGSIEEIGLVPDMPAEVVARLRPWLSVYGEGIPVGYAEGSPVAVAVGEDRSNARPSGPERGDRTWRIVATAVLPGRAVFHRSAVVGLGGATGGGAPPSRTLAWE